MTGKVAMLLIQGSIIVLQVQTILILHLTLELLRRPRLVQLRARSSLKLPQLPRTEQMRA